MKEYLDIFDENNVSLNQSKERTIVHKQGLWHREIAVWIINKNKEVLIQKRSANKKLGANKWALCAGHVTSGENLIEGAVREVQEEVGISKLCPSDLRLFYIQKVESNDGEIKNNHYKYCYLLKTDEVKYVSLDYLKNMTKEERNEFTRFFSSKELEITLNKLEKKLKEIEED